jgi:hypothetical protein
MTKRKCEREREREREARSNREEIMKEKIDV